MAYSNAYFQALEVLILMDITSKKHEGGFLSTKLIAASLGLPQASAAKILAKLKSANLITAKEGSHGGMALEKMLSEITMLDVLNAIEAGNSLFKTQNSMKIKGEVVDRINTSIKNELSKTELIMKDSLKSKTLKDLLKDYDEDIFCNENVTLEGEEKFQL
ncbi:Rrf2 family transcriptional regulator [Candidatus Enterococcus mansonii]|uniref:Rrf2 family transcriptional regulator n=1 Tax=Candidatus Enterococcus mansonii TaxID=1834181 RepID=A0ABU8IIE9_9ENTE